MASANHPVSRPPTALTSFVGRRQELAEVKLRMEESRLVTLTGPGGVGKTRVALEVAARAQRGFRDGVWIVKLASLEDDAGLAHAIASALHLPDQSNRDPRDKLVDFLRDRQLMIVVDNCEHLLKACALLIDTLLRASPGLRILATSREPLRIDGEAICVIPPLSTPAGTQTYSPKGILHYEAVSLLVERARSILPDFAVTAQNADAIVQLCTRLDGIPLAIELAATRLRSLSVTQVVDRLDRRFSLLTGGNRIAMPRQQTLRALIDWSYDLCTENEQRLWAQLSVFPGSFDLDAVEETCGSAIIPAEHVADILDRLVAKSIVMTERSGERVRYRQLMTVREYGAELLAASGETQQLKRRQRDHYLKKAASMVQNWCGPGQSAALAVMRDDHANLVSALEWSLSAAEEFGTAAELASLLRYHWIVGGYLGEGRRWLDQITRSSALPKSQRGQALWVGAWVALMQGDAHAAAEMLSECEAIADALADESMLAHTILWRGLVEFVSGDIAAAIELYERSIDIHTELGDLALTLTASFQLAICHAYNSDVTTALQICGRAIDISAEHGELWNRSYATWITGLCLWLRGEPESAREAATTALLMGSDFKDSIGTALTIELLSWIAASAHDFRTSADLASTASTVWEGLGTDVKAFGPHLRQNSAHYAGIVQEALGEKAIANLSRQNASLTLEAAVAKVLGKDKHVHPAPGSPLTKREGQVAELVAEGLSNKAIAESLVLSPRTVDGHVEHILTKLNFSSRTQIASWVASGSTR